MTTQRTAAWADELAKLSWGGSYYHGASAPSERSILRSGLKASMGGKGQGAVAQFEDLIGKPVAGLKRRTKGRVTMSRSKNIARLYGTMLDPGRREGIAKALGPAYAPDSTRRQRLGSVRDAAMKFLDYQPLKARGVHGLKRDPDHFFTAVQSRKDVPSKLISRATPRKFSVGSIVRKVLTRGKA